MTDEAIVAALQTLRPTSQLGDRALFRVDLVEAAGIDLAVLERWASAHGGGTVDAGQLKLRKGQPASQGRAGRPEQFIAVPLAALR